MMKFACFERTVELLYKHVVPKPRDQCSKGEQLIVTFAAGYIAGVFCAIVSHPGNKKSIKLVSLSNSIITRDIKKWLFYFILSWYGCIEVEQWKGLDSWRGLETRWFLGLVERSSATYYYDWYTHSLAMVYLWHGESRSRFAQTTTTTTTKDPTRETRCSKIRTTSARRFFKQQQQKIYH